MTRTSLNRILSLTLVACFGLAGWAAGQTILTAPVGTPAPYLLDSGDLDNPSDEVRSVFRETIRVEGAAWIRLYFDAVTLRPGSTLAITSLSDFAVQHHTNRTIVEWENTSAYFNGDAVEIELFAGPGTTGNRIALREVTYETPSGNVAGSLCGLCNGDDRVPSEARFAGRLMPVGCSASLFNPEGCFVSAGHCMGAAFVMEFQVPFSLSNGSLQHPGPRDQYPVLSSSIEFVNCCVGLDWGYFQCGANTETGLFPIEVQKDYRPIANTIPDEFPVELEIFGYGISLTGELNQTQKRGIGPLLSVQSGFGSQELAWFHDVDTTGGNSGSSILYNGEIIGIVTHCTGGCPNIGTLINRPDFAAAREACPGRRGDCDGDGDTDMHDIIELNDCMTGPRQGPFDPECACSSYDGDPDIDLRDVAVLMKAFSGELCFAPQFVQQPFDQLVCEGTPVFLQASAQGRAGISYQWHRDGAPIEGATEPNLLITEATSLDFGAYYVHASNVCGELFSDVVTVEPCVESLLSSTFETSDGWTVTSDPGMVRGQWFRAIPDETLVNGYIDQIAQPGVDSPSDAGSKCFGTGPFGGAAVSNDVDGGPTTLFSPVFDITGRNRVTLRYAYWFFRNNDDGDDALELSISNDGGSTWQLLTRHAVSSVGWRTNVIDLPTVITPSNQVQLRFDIRDAGGETLLEALVDDVQVTAAD